MRMTSEYINWKVEIKTIIIRILDQRKWSNKNNVFYFFFITYKIAKLLKYDFSFVSNDMKILCVGFINYKNLVNSVAAFLTKNYG